MLPQTSQGQLVGRVGELTRLLARLAEASSRQAVVALVSGDAGVGKTRLVAELAKLAGERGFTVLSGRCAEVGDSVPYLPLADALRDATRAQSGHTAAPLLDALASRPVLGRLLPDQGTGEPAGGDGSGLARQQLFGAVLGLLAELADAAPVLLVLEDLHWADRSTRDLVTFLSRVLHREPIAVVGTYRSDDLHRRHPLRPVVAELLRLPGVSLIELGPLNSSAMAEHLTALAGTNVQLKAATLNGIVARAEGNAYYAEELLSASADGEALPAGLAALLLGRVERLSDTAQQVLRIAAVAGRRADDELVREVSGLPAAAYEDAVREAVAQQLLVPDGAEGYAFRHALLREAVYADLLPGERTRLHASLAALLTDGGRYRALPGRAAELAHHCLASHDIPGALAASVRAGQEAERLAAPAEAHRHYDQALSLWERVSEPEELAGIQRGALALLSASNAAASGDVSRAVQQLRRLQGFLDSGADPVLASRAGERLAYFLLETGEFQDAVAAAQAAASALPENPPSWQYARALATYAYTLLFATDEPWGADADEQARGQAEQARAAARAAAAPWVEADALVTLGQLAERNGQSQEAIDLFTLAHRQAREARVLGVELRAAFQLARAQLERGDLGDALVTAHEGVRRTGETGLGLAPYGLDLQFLHYQGHYNDGSWEHAQELADGFLVRVTTVAEALLSAMALFVDVARGNAVVQERRSWMEPFWRTDGFGEYIARGLLAEHALWQGDTGTAVAEVAAAIRAQLRSTNGIGPPIIRVAAVGLAAWADRADQARAISDEDSERAAVDEARALIEAAREAAAYRRRPKFVLGRDGRGWLARAEAEWLRVQGAGDPDAWQTVLDTFTPAFVYEAARSRWRLAEALAEAGRRDEAQEQWRLAAEAADRLGAAPLRAALDTLARRARLGHTGSASLAGQPGGDLAALTVRELEVLRLLAAGRSNREIGAALYIASKTASVHVSNILAKLGAASRTEAAAIAHRQGLLPSAAADR